MGRVILGRPGRFVFRNPMWNQKAMSLATSRTRFGHTRAAVWANPIGLLEV